VRAAWRDAEEQARAAFDLVIVSVLVRQSLGFSETNLPLGKILEGGTWALGRQLKRFLIYAIAEQRSLL